MRISLRRRFDDTLLSSAMKLNVCNGASDKSVELSKSDGMRDARRVASRLAVVLQTDDIEPAIHKHILPRHPARQIAQ
jgi:hypothetical protein